MSVHKNWPVEDRRRAQRWEANFKGAVLVAALLMLGFLAGYSAAADPGRGDASGAAVVTTVQTLEELDKLPAVEELTAPPEEPPEMAVPELEYVGEFTVTHYCCETHEHICGNGDGLTATGTEVTAYRSCAVDPAVIPLGTALELHMADGRILHYIAEDVGGAVKGNKIDLALPTHEEALAAGITTASVFVLEGAGHGE